MLPAAEVPDLRPLPVFTYGTLLDERFVANLLERPIPFEPAHLAGYRVEILPRFRWPVLVPTEGSVVEGRLYRGVGPMDLERLDAYEGVGDGLYRRVEVIVAPPGRDAEPAWVYLPTERTLSTRARR